VPEPPHKLIDLMEEQKKLHTKGGNMRLGQWRTLLKEGSRAQQVYGQTEIVERHRHRYEFNRAYQERLEEKGMVFSGVSPEGDLVEVIELKDHPFFMACQYHPEFLSKPNQPHPLFRAFIAASLSYSE
jgi:CTP synthase